jgi:RNA polymerase subunit RPABC4/transcription elongation factor Spt4
MALTKCKECGHDVSKQAKTCPNCGAPMRKKRSIVRWALLLLLIVIFVEYGTGRHTDHPKLTSASTVKRQPAELAETSNPGHNALMRMTPSDRAKFLGQVVESGGTTVCGNPTRSFFQGFDKYKGAYWNVACSNGMAYSVQIAADKGGSTKVLDCGLLKILTKVECFEKLN